MDARNKIISINDAATLGMDDVALCYGHFNIIHPGHLRYLQHAKTLAQKLVVVVVSDKDLDEDLFGRHFTEIERAESVGNIQNVDYVIILNDSLSDAINTIKPKALVLGKEFEKNQSKKIENAINIVNNFGSVVFHAGEVHYSTSSLFYENVSDIENNGRNQLNEICINHKITLRKLKNRLNSFSNSKLIVIGDTIVDNYVACDAIGMSAEAPVLVVQELENREFVGGAAIVVLHAQALGAKCHYISVVGDDRESSIINNTLKDQHINMDLFIDKSRPTTYKTRYMVENQKLFRVSRIKDHKISKEIEKKIIDKLTVLASDADGIMVSDFVYGVITQNILDAISELSKQFNIRLYADLQCSSQVGKVSKFNNFDLITPTEKEARIALDDNENGVEWIANTLSEYTNSKNILIKLGSDGFIAYGNVKPKERQNFPALTINPVDVTGAGDSLFAAMSVALSSGASLMEASVIGVCMASLSVKKVGNISISKEKLDNYMSSLLLD